MRRVLPWCLGAFLVCGGFARAQQLEVKGDWPQWRGPARDGVSQEAALLKAWPAEGPRVLWHVEDVGRGYSSLAIVNGRLYTQGDLDGVEHVLCLSAADGRRVWATRPAPVVEKLDERLAAEFKRLDLDANGKIDEIEALGKLGGSAYQFDRAPPADAQAVAQARAARMLKHFDASGDGRVTYAECKGWSGEFSRIDAIDKALSKEQAVELAKTRAARIFKETDADADGRVTKAEAKGTFLDSRFGSADQKDPAVNKGDDTLTLAELEVFFEKQENAKDGELTAAEIADHYFKRFPGGDGELSLEEYQASIGGFRNDQGDGPRGTPTVEGDRVYTVGGNGDLTCFAAATGKTIWHRNLSEHLGGGRPGWGYCESPLIVGEKLIVTPGGKQGTLAALNKMTGETIWRSTGITEGAHYASPVLAEIGGIRQIVQFGSQNVFGVALEDGRWLWSYKAPANGTANVCTPIVEGDLVFGSSSYGTGGGLAKIITENGQQRAEQVYFDKAMANHHGGIVKIGEHMYGFGNGGLICMHFATGKVAWTNRSVNKGSLVSAGGMLYLLGEGHQAALAEASPGEYRESGRIKLTSQGRPSWAHPVVAGGRLYIRDQHTLTAYDVSAK